jgi:uncharacterized protein (DUF1684 family)
MIKKLIYFSIVLLMFVSCSDGKRYHKEEEISKKAAVTSTYDFEFDIKNHQEMLNEEYANPKTSPLYDRHRVDFEGLDFFAPDERFRVKARLIVTPNTTPFMMPTTNKKVEKEERVYGILEFELLSKTYQLEVYQSSDLMKTTQYADYLFLPFTDLTNGKETYGGGRYIDLRIPKSDSIIVDFNKSYNPFCAYNVNYACPKVPKVNHLEVAIQAGVKKFNP